MANVQYSGVRESRPGRVNDLGTTGKEVEENYKRVPEASRSKLCAGLTVSADQQYGSTDVIR